MSEHENVGIELGVNADGALQTLQELTTAAKAADATIQELKQHMTEQVNAAFGAQGLRPQNYEQAQGFLQRMPAADLAAASPEIVATQQAISARSGAITGAAMDVAGAPGAANQPVQQLLDQVRQLLTVQQQQQATGGAPDAGGSAASPQARYGGTPSGGSGSPWPAATFPFGGTSPTDATQQDRGANLIGQRMAEALTRSAGGLMAGGIQGAANAAGMGATGDLVGGLARPLMSMLGEFAAPLAAVVAVGAGGLAVNSQQAHYAQEQQTLSGAVGTTTDATPSSELTTAQQAGWAMMYHEADSVAAARQLGMAGVQSGQLGTAVTASGALARVGGIGLDQTTALTAQMMQGGMTAEQVGQSYAQMDQAARLTGVSVGRLTEGMRSMNQAAGVGQISINGLAAAQALAGTSVNFAQASSGTVGSTGTGALSQAAMLGLTPAQFEQAQKDPARLMDSYAQLARRYDVGTGGVQIAQQALSTAGFDFSGMKGPQADEFTRRLVAQGPDAAQKYEDSLTKKENAPGAPGPHNFAELTQASVTVAHNITSASEQVKLDLEQGAAALVRAVDGVKITTPLTAPAAHAQSSANEAQQAIIDTARKRGAAAQLHIVQTAQNPAAKAQALLAYEAITSGQDYANDPNAAGTMDASGSPQFGGLSEYQLSQARQSGTWVGGGPGKGSFVSADTFHAYEQAARKTGTPLAVLLAQGKQEATINGTVDPLAGTGPGHGGNLPGIGLGQWTPGPHNENLPAVEHYLGMASKDLGMGAVTDRNWQQAALNPRVSALATGIYDANNYASKEAGGRWDHALAQYNAGPNGWNYTGHPGQGRDYGTTVDQGALKVEVQLGGSVDITQNGHKVGSAQAGQHIRAKATHSVDPSKKHVASQSYGPDQRPPSPGMPNLPGHIK